MESCSYSLPLNSKTLTDGGVEKLKVILKQKRPYYAEWMAQAGTKGITNENKFDYIGFKISD